MHIDLVGLGDQREVVATAYLVAAGTPCDRLGLDFVEYRLLGAHAQQFFRLHRRKGAGQQLGLGGRHQQMLGAVQGGALFQGRVELKQFVFVDLGQRGNP